jgi:hypothetical protein
LPQVANPSARTVVLAIRVWHWAGWDLLIGGGFYAAPLLGQTSLLQARMQERESALSHGMVSLVVLAFELSRWRDGRCCIGYPRALLAV